MCLYSLFSLLLSDDATIVFISFIFFIFFIFFNFFIFPK